MHASANRRVAFIGMDGTPYSFIRKEMEAGNLPNLAALAKRGEFVPMQTEIPTISSVAWASFMTGVNPAVHGIYGFTDRKPGTYELYFPNYAHLKAEPIWDRMSQSGKRCCVINVPSTYPARPLNGVLVSGFVAPNLQKATYPAEALEYLERTGYRIDVDAAKAHDSLDLLLEDLHDTLEKRREAMLHFWRSEPWDFFMCVFTGTDRLHHFLWKQYEEGDPVYAPEFLRFYRRLDEIVGEFAAELPDGMPLFLMSDHGFCSLDRQVYLNYLLQTEGLLAFTGDNPVTIADIDPGRTRAYCMDPGRVYINLKGREPGGTVSPGAEYDQLMERISQLLGNLTDPESGERMVESVPTGCELFEGPLADLAPDLVAVPVRGYDFKGMVNRDTLTDAGIFTGMHTHDDAMLYSNIDMPAGNRHIRDVAGLILNAMGE
jgi:predicted AlkP superfamily phosphohydrolase/phosphomutase